MRSSGSERQAPQREAHPVVSEGPDVVHPHPLRDERKAPDRRRQQQQQVGREGRAPHGRTSPRPSLPDLAALPHLDDQDPGRDQHERDERHGRDRFVQDQLREEHARHRNEKDERVQRHRPVDLQQPGPGDEGEARREQDLEADGDHDPEVHPAHHGGVEHGCGQREERDGKEHLVEDDLDRGDAAHQVLGVGRAAGPDRGGAEQEQVPQHDGAARPLAVHEDADRPRAAQHEPRQLENGDAVPRQEKMRQEEQHERLQVRDQGPVRSAGVGEGDVDERQLDREEDRVDDERPQTSGRRAQAAARRGRPNPEQRQRDAEAHGSGREGAEALEAELDRDRVRPPEDTDARGQGGGRRRQVPLGGVGFHAVRRAGPASALRTGTPRSCRSCSALRGTRSGSGSPRRARPGGRRCTRA